MKEFFFRRRLLFSTAILWWLAGAFQLFPLGWVALAPFFVSLEGKSKVERLRIVYTTGFVSFWLINWWLIPTITTGSPAIGVPVFFGFFLSLLAVSLIAAIHALQLALVALLWTGNPRFKPLFVALAWVLGDYVRSLTPIAHEWGALAFSQVTDLPFLQLASVFTQHGLTFVCALVAAWSALWWQSRDKKWLILPGTVLLAVHIWGLVRLAQPLTGHPLRVLVVQTAVASLSKSVGATGETAYPQAFRLTSQAVKENKGKPYDLIVWPETTANLNRFGSMYNGLDWETWRREGPRVPLMMGALVMDEKQRAWNEAILVSPAGQTQVRPKTRLVPFGERAPWVEYLPFLQVLAPNPMVEIGDGPKTFDLTSETSPAAALDTQICFETCFPQHVNGKLLVVLTNDEWFSGTEAPRQHRAMAIMRAVEMGCHLCKAPTADTLSS